MKDTLYRTILLYTKLSPPAVWGIIPKIGKKKILEKLEKYNVSEQDVDRTEEIENGKARYAVWLGEDLLLEINEL